MGWWMIVAFCTRLDGERREECWRALQADELRGELKLTLES